MAASIWHLVKESIAEENGEKVEHQNSVRHEGGASSWKGVNISARRNSKLSLGYRSPLAPEK
jgi:hypothetical protein